MRLPKGMRIEDVEKRAKALTVEVDVIDFQLRKNKQLTGIELVRLMMKHKQINEECDLLYSASAQLRKKEKK